MEFTRNTMDGLPTRAMAVDNFLLFPPEYVPAANIIIQCSASLLMNIILFLFEINYTLEYFHFVNVSYLLC